MGRDKKHAFRIDLAVEYGVIKAIILHNLIFWIELNAKKGINFKKDPISGNWYHWTFSSAKEMQKRMPYLSVKTIRTNLIQLEYLGLIITGNFNKMKYDRTKWYCIRDWEVEDPKIIDERE